MHLRIISISLASLLFLILFIYILINSRSIDRIKFTKQNNKFVNYLCLPFFCFLSYNDYILDKLLPSKLKLAIKNLYGEEAYRYTIVDYSSKVFMYIFYSLFTFLLINSIFGEIIILITMLVFCIFLWTYFINQKIKEYENINKRIKSDLPNFISRLILLISSGINIRQGIKYISKSTNGDIVDQFKFIQNLVDNGYSEEEAYYLLISKTDDILIRKFLSTIVGNLKKGDSEIEKTLNLIKNESISYKKNKTILDAQEINRKLLMPNLLIFLAIMLMVMLPILLNVL